MRRITVKAEIIITDPINQYDSDESLAVHTEIMLNNLGCITDGKKKLFIRHHFKTIKNEMEATND